MKTLLKNGKVLNVFTGELENADVLIEDARVLGVGDYTDSDADVVEDVAGKYICPGLIDGHIHIESTMLTPAELARVCVAHGTTAIVADPHEIANVSGVPGIRYMLEASEGLPMTVYVVLPSCVPATPHDEAGAVLSADDLRPLYDHPRVIGLGEVMNYVGVLAHDADLLQKISDARERGKIVNGHAPLVTGRALDGYVAAGISDDHECSSADEAKERVRKGQWVMIRQGTAARNLRHLLPLLDEPWWHRCLLVSDDKHPADLLESGHIDATIREAVRCGKSAVTAIRMATLGAAQCLGLDGVGAVAPGYVADLLVLDDLDGFAVRDVYRHGKRVVKDGVTLPFDAPTVDAALERTVRHSFDLDELSAADLHLDGERGLCRVIRVIPDQLLTDEMIAELDLTQSNGVDVSRDILKLAVIERHHHTGHIGLGFIHGLGLTRGAIASSVSHDSHNLIVVGTNEQDMALAANRIRAMGGGNVVVEDGQVLAEMPLPIGGLMTDADAAQAAAQNLAVRRAVERLGVADRIEPFMNMAFISLPVIPHLKMTTRGLIDVDTQTLLPLFV